MNFALADPAGGSAGGAQAQLQDGEPYGEEHITLVASIHVPAAEGAVRLLRAERHDGTAVSEDGVEVRLYGAPQNSSSRALLVAAQDAFLFFDQLGVPNQKARQPLTAAMKALSRLLVGKDAAKDLGPKIWVNDSGEVAKNTEYARKGKTKLVLVSCDRIMSKLSVLHNESRDTKWFARWNVFFSMVGEHRAAPVAPAAALAAPDPAAGDGAAAAAAAAPAAAAAASAAAAAAAAAPVSGFADQVVGLGTGAGSAPGFAAAAAAAAAAAPVQELEPSLRPMVLADAGSQTTEPIPQFPPSFPTSTAMASSPSAVAFIAGGSVERGRPYWQHGKMRIAGNVRQDTSTNTIAGFNGMAAVRGDGEDACPLNAQPARAADLAAEAAVTSLADARRAAHFVGQTLSGPFQLEAKEERSAAKEAASKASGLTIAAAAGAAQKQVPSIVGSFALGVLGRRLDAHLEPEEEARRRAVEETVIKMQYPTTFAGQQMRLTATMAQAAPPALRRQLALIGGAAGARRRPGHDDHGSGTGSTAAAADEGGGGQDKEEKDEEAGIEAGLDSHITQQIGAGDEATLTSDNIGMTNGEGVRLEKTTWMARIIPASRLADLGGIPFSGVHSLRSGSYPPGWDSLYATMDDAGHEAYERKCERRDKFVRSQERDDVMIGPEDLLAKPHDVDFLLLRLVLRFDAVFDLFEAEGFDVPLGERPNQRWLRASERRHRSKKSQQWTSDPVPGEVLAARQSVFRRSNFNLLRDNDMRLFETLEMTYSKEETLQTVEARAKAALRVGQEDGVRQKLLSYGDGAPVMQRTLPNGQSADSDVMWIMGQWHKRNNHGLHVCQLWREAALASKFSQAGGCHTAGRVDFACNWGSVRRTLDQLESFMDAMVMEMVVQFSKENVPGFAKKSALEGDDPNSDEDVDVQQMAKEAAAEASSADGDAAAETGKDGEGEGDEEDEEHSDDDEGGYGVLLVDDDPAPAGGGISSDGGDDGDGLAKEEMGHFVEVEGDSDDEPGRKGENDDADDGDGGGGGGNGAEAAPAEDQKTTLATDAAEVLAFFLRRGKTKKVLQSVLVMMTMLDVMEAFEESWKMGPTLQAQNLYHWALLMSTHLDFMAGADHYARLGPAQRLQYEMTDLYTQMLLVMGSALEGKTCYVSPDFLTEQVQFQYKKETKHVSAFDLQRQYEELSHTLEGIIDRRVAKAQIRFDRPDTRGTVPPREVSMLTNAARLWIREHNILGRGPAKTDKGDPIPGLGSLTDGTSLNGSLLSFFDIGATRGKADIQALLFAADPPKARKNLPKFKATKANVEKNASLLKARRKETNPSTLAAKLRKEEKVATGRTQTYTMLEMKNVINLYLDKGFLKPKGDEDNGKGRIKSQKLASKPSMANIICRARNAAKRKNKLHVLAKAELEYDKEVARRAGVGVEGAEPFIDELDKSLERLRRGSVIGSCCRRGARGSAMPRRTVGVAVRYPGLLKQFAPDAVLDASPLPRFGGGEEPPAAAGGKTGRSEGADTDVEEAAAANDEAGDDSAAGAAAAAAQHGTGGDKDKPKKQAPLMDSLGGLTAEQEEAVHRFFTEERRQQQEEAADLRAAAAAQAQQRRLQDAQVFDDIMGLQLQRAERLHRVLMHKQNKNPEKYEVDTSTGVEVLRLGLKDALLAVLVATQVLPEVQGRALAGLHR
eukprot:g257.t1